VLAEKLKEIKINMAAYDLALKIKKLKKLMIVP